MTSLISHLGNAFRNTWHNSGEIKEEGVKIHWDGGRYDITLPDAKHQKLSVTVKDNSSAELKMDKKTKHIFHNLERADRETVRDSIDSLKKTIVVFHDMRQADRRHSKNHVLQSAQNTQSKTIRNLAQTILHAKTNLAKEQFSCTTNVEKKHHRIKVTAEGSLNGEKGTLTLKKKGDDTTIESKLASSSELYKRLKAEAEKKV